ncbi:MAG: holo-ACP synthase [Candidatus Omnitrophica bacterium]|nr:holo-ACP synthase [Candidatus Omnitrophota bacterium]
MILGAGIDIIEIDRIQRAIERWGEDFLNHVFTPQEIAHAQKYKFPYPHYAGRFAAKEAVFKALGNAQVTWKDLNIVNDPQGKPYCEIRNHDFYHTIFLTISHSRDYAVATAIVEA